MPKPVQPIFLARRLPEKQYLHLSKLCHASPWPNADVSFHWTNFDYPYLHAHEYWELLILVSGALRHEVNGKSITLKQHHACLLRPSDCHGLYAIGSEPVTILNFMVKPEYITPILAAYGASMVEKLHTKEDLTFTVSETLLNECVSGTQVLQLDATIPYEERIDRCRTLFINLLSELMTQNITAADHKPKWLSDFLLELSQSDLSGTVAKSNIIEQSNYSYSRLIRLFKKYMGCTISQYISHLRIERAKEYLKDVNMRIIDVATAVGFDNVTYFNRVFKSATGQTPSEYRKNYGQFHQESKSEE